LFNLKFSPLEVILLVKRIVSIADANRVLRMVRTGRAVPVSQLRSALLLIDDSRKTMMSTNRSLKRSVGFLNGLLDRTLK